MREEAFRDKERFNMMPVSGEWYKETDLREKFARLYREKNLRVLNLNSRLAAAATAAAAAVVASII